MVGGSGMFNGVDGNDLQFAVWARTRTIKIAQITILACRRPEHWDRKTRTRPTLRARTTPEVRRRLGRGATL